MQSRCLSLGQWLNKSWYIHTTKTNDAGNNLDESHGHAGWEKKRYFQNVRFHLYNFEMSKL